MSGIRTRLLVLILLAVLPALGLTLYIGLDQRQNAITQVRGDALLTARLASSIQGSVVEAAQQLVVALSELPPAQLTDPARCAPLFIDLRRNFPDYANIGVALPDGRVVCSAVPLEAPTTVSDRSYFQRAMRNRGFAVGDYQVGRITSAPTLNFAYPAMDEQQEVRAIVYAALPLERFHVAVADLQLPAGATITVVDAQGTVLSRRPDPAAWGGKQMPESPLVQAIRTSAQGSARERGLDGIVREYAWAPVLGTADTISVAIGVPYAAIVDKPNEMLRHSLIGLTLAAAAALGAAWWGGNAFLVRPLRSVVAATERLAAGDLETRVDIGDRHVRELEQLGRAFDTMAGILQMRDFSLRTSEARFRRLAEHAPDIIYRYRLGPTPGFEYVSPAVTGMVGYSPEEHYADPDLAQKLVHPEDRSRLATLVRSNGAPAQPVELRWRRADGTVIWTEHRLTVVETEGNSTLEGIARDITERKQAEMRLAAQVATARVLSHATSFQEAAPPLLQAIGESMAWKWGELWLMPVGQNGQNQPHPLRCAATWQAPEFQPGRFAEETRRLTLASGEGLPGYTWSAGRPTWVLDVTIAPQFHRAETAADVGIRTALAFPIRGSTQVLGVIAFFSTDVRPVDDNLLEACETLGSQIGQFVERAQAEQALVESNRQLVKAVEELQAAQSKLVEQERLRALGQMASGIAHDFNNALAPVIGFSELLLAQPAQLADPERVRASLELILAGAEDAATVVRRLREFYRTRDPEHDVHPVDVTQEVSQVLSLTQAKWKDQAQAEGRLIVVQTDLAPVPPIRGGAAEVREALTNLIFNAVDAMPHGGTLMLRTRSDDKQVVVEVGDTGTGMPEDVRQRCLEPFFTTKGASGTGLGLAMVYGTVKRHAGVLEIDSEIGQGSTFRLRLPTTPAADATALTANAVIAREPEPLPLQRVLVVDDEDAVREVEVAFLRIDGHSVEAVSTGSEALSRLASSTFDVVITDRAMPGMNGDQLALAIKARWPDLRLVLATGYGDLMAASGESPPGVDAVAAKPLTHTRLRAALAQALRKTKNVNPDEPLASS